ncbi:MAG: MFS transporter [Bacillota bacterium]|nr:MFS transporter [Bacillota bacterium]
MINTKKNISIDNKAKDSSRLTLRLRIILAIVLIANTLDLMDSTITNIAAPSIVNDIGGGQWLIKWLGASYALAIGVLLVIGGRLGDKYGKRRMYLTGIAGFTIASAICGLSVNPTMIIAGRLIQGSFGALLIPQGVSILMATFSREQLPKAFSSFGPIMGLASISGPIAAGLIIDANIGGLHWRPMFLINISFGIVGFIAAFKVLPHDKANSNEKLDVTGSILLGLMMFGLILGLIQGSTNGWTTLPIISIIGGAIMFIAFGFRQKYAANPLIKLTLLSNKGFTSGLLMELGFFAALNGFVYVISLFFQLMLHFTPSKASLGMAPTAIGIIISSLICKPLLSTLGRKLVALGLLTTLVGTLGLFAIISIKGAAVSALMSAPAIFILGLGMGACISSIYDIAIGDVAQEETGSASGSLSAIQQLAAAIGSAVITTIFFNVLEKAGGVSAMTTCILVVAGIIVLCFGLVGLLPQKSPAEK